MKICYVAIESIIYDISNATVRSGSTHFERTAGQDLTSQFDSSLGKTPQKAINQVQEWQNTDVSQLLNSATSTGTSGSIGSGIKVTNGSGVISIGGSTGISGNTNKNNRLYLI